MAERKYKHGLRQVNPYRDPSRSSPLLSSGVKAFIKHKFGSISQFARITKQDRYELQMLFSRINPEQAELKRLFHLANKTDVVPTEKDIAPEHVEALRKALDDYGGVIKFTRDHPQFSKDSIFQILSGRKKRMTDKKKELFTFLNIAI